MRACFTFTAKSADKPAVLALDDEIGFWGTQAKDFRAALDSVDGDDLVVEINSPGGDVFAGLGMYNMLRTWAAADGRTITTKATLAASIASVIMLAGDKREMPKNAFAMIHAASSLAWGTAEEMRETAATLDKIDGSIRGIYIDRMGVDEAKAKELMAKDTWLTADECKELGFLTDVTSEAKATAKFDLARAALPERVTAIFKPKAQITPPKTDPVDPPVADETPLADQISAKVKAAGLEAYAKTFMACDTLEAAEARIDRAKEIVAYARVAERPDDAKKAIKKDMPVAEFRAALVKAMAEADVDIDTTPPTPPNKPTASTAMQPGKAWNSHHAQDKSAQKSQQGR